MKVFSLIIPVFNEEKTLKDIISEVLTIENDIFFKNNNISLELVLIDDFSSDNSYNILKSFENPKIKDYVSTYIVTLFLFLGQILLELICWFRNWRLICLLRFLTGF